MKKILLTTVIILTVCMASMANRVVARGQSNSAFGEYKIEQSDNHLMFQNKELDQYLITYEKSDVKVVVVLDKQKKCKKYYVLTDQIPVQYECDGTCFGIKKLDKELLSMGFKTSLDDINRAEFFHQRVIISGMTNTIDHLQLIASYYPGLFN